MPERDWQADMELCCKVQELMRKYEGYVPVDVLERKLDFPMQALKGWPAALEERARLEARVKELETALEIAAREITNVNSDFDTCPSDYDGELTCTCNGTIADVYRCWRERWKQKALAALEGGSENARA